MPWIILILIMPVLGVCLYLMFQTNKGTRNMRKRYQEIDAICCRVCRKITIFHIA